MRRKPAIEPRRYVHSCRVCGRDHMLTLAALGKAPYCYRVTCPHCMQPDNLVFRNRRKFEECTTPCQPFERGTPI